MKMKLTTKEMEAFAKIGAAIVATKEAAKIKKDEMAHVKDVLAQNKAAFAEGLVIGKYKFSTVERVELVAMPL